MSKLFKHIIGNNTEDYIAEKIDEYIPEYVWDWEDEYDDIHEAYLETGRGQAEHQIINEVIVLGAKALELQISSDEHCDLFDKLVEHWNLDTD
jgi:hypothetical protein